MVIAIDFEHIPTTGGIYQILNTKNGKFYIGSSKNLRKRCKTHFSNLRKNKHKNIILQQAFNKYGIEAFNFNIIEKVEDFNNLINREQYYIDTLNPKYNINKIANSSLGVKRRFETIEKIRNANLGLKHSEERNRIKSIAQGGNNHWTKHKQFSEEAKKHMSESQKNLYKNGYISPRSIKINQFTLSGQFIKTWNSAAEASKKLNYSRQGINNCVNGKIKQSNNYIWKKL